MARETSAQVVEAVSVAARGVVNGRVVGVDRLRGGSKKGVYRVRFDGGSSVVVYRWAAEENFWPEVAEVDVFADASGMDLFLAAGRVLDEVGVRTPRVLAVGVDVVVVEDVSGGTLESVLGTDRARVALGDLARFLGAMRGRRSPGFGRVDRPLITGSSCERVVFDRAVRDLAEAAGRDGRVERAHDDLRELVVALRERVAPRAEYGLIHGELGPDHVLVGADGGAVLIDVEGLMFFDVEWEHVFLRLRFGPHYAPLACSDLDGARLDFYGLAMRLSLVAGPLRLLDGDFPDREFMVRVVERNLGEALALLP
ncbi:phosphotransferase [Actinokineospora auranticolor]|uniref:phosphotransferase family protein n=1 Tax=Actinokineospora auranticolor TaxID=155976 RepID=UPI001CA50E57|nr:phosphotransferase [Actinokineospora auranticolor]